jgi:hypothetical protein
MFRAKRLPPEWLLVLALLLFVPSGLPAQQESSDRARLLQLHAELIRAHVEGRVDLWMSLEAEGYASVNGGRVTFPSLAERRGQRGAYLDATTFTTYRDLREPIVTISQDGSLGWLIAEVEVAGATAGRGGESRTFGDVWAWIELYEKIDGEWRMVGNASNRR